MELQCEHCFSKNLVWSWRREFNLVANGWRGWHEYWKCKECNSGYFGVGEIDKLSTALEIGECCGG